MKVHERPTGRSEFTSHPFHEIEERPPHWLAPPRLETGESNRVLPMIIGDSEAHVIELRRRGE